MKTSVHELLDGMNAAELDSLPELDSADLSDEQMNRITALAGKKAGIGSRRRKSVRRRVLIAACIALLMGTLVGCYAVDEAQVTRAKEFFDLNHFSTDGLSRGEIKRVYRDLTTESLSYDKTAEVLNNSLHIDGAEITILNAYNSTWAQDHAGEDILLDDDLMRRADTDGTATDADGNTAAVSASEKLNAGDARYLIFLLNDADGHLIARRETRMDDLLSVRRTAPLSSGWLVEVCVRDPGEYNGYKTVFLRLNGEGEVVQQFAYDDAEREYSVRDMIEYGGKIYLSATARPVDSKLYDGLEDMLQSDDLTLLWSGYTDLWRDRAREEFSAVLLELDSATGTPEQFFTVGGAFAGGLGTDEDGQLTWSVGRIVACGFSPATSAYSLYGAVRRYDYTFDSDENLLTQERTDRFGGFVDH